MNQEDGCGPKNNPPPLEMRGQIVIILYHGTGLVSGILDSGLGQCYRNIATEMGTFRGAIIQILLR